MMSILAGLFMAHRNFARAAPTLSTGTGGRMAKPVDRFQGFSRTNRTTFSLNETFRLVVHSFNLR